MNRQEIEAKIKELNRKNQELRDDQKRIEALYDHPSQRRYSPTLRDIIYELIDIHEKLGGLIDQLKLISQKGE
jgi:hypothetical protein